MPFDVNDPQSVISYVLGLLTLFLSITVHEYAHGWSAYKMGDNTAKNAGRLTLNPIKHMDLIGTLVILLGAPVGWAKPVPINSNNFTGKYRGRLGNVIVSLSGVTANLLMAVAAYLLRTIVVTAVALSGNVPTGAGGAIVANLLLFCLLMFYRNIGLAIFNLLPVPPLDGFKFVGSFLPVRWYFFLLRYERWIGLALFLLLLVNRGSFLSGILNTLAAPVIWLISTPLDALARLIIGGAG